MEKLCIFCRHFTWTKRDMWGMGSTLTGPMFEGGWAKCAKGVFGDFNKLEMPEDEADYRRVILMGEKCGMFEPVDMPAKSE